MSYILRKKYLNKIKPFIDKPIVKVITGMRRVGKSTLLKMIQSELLVDVPQSCLLYTSPSPRDISGSRMPSSA